MIGTLFRHEVRMLFRDRRTVLIAVVAPLVLFPLFILASNWVEARESTRLESQTYEIAVTGPRAAWAEEIVDAALALEADAPEPSVADGDPAGPAARTGEVDRGSDEEETIAPAAFLRLSAPAPDSLLAAGALHVVVVGREAVPDDSLAPGTAVLELRYRADSDFSRNARERLQERILAVRSAMRDSVFLGAGFPVRLGEVAVFEAENLAGEGREGGSLLGGLLVPFLILLMLSGGSIVAADSISGEKERGTLETLLTTATSRRDIVFAKLGAIMAVGLAAGVINVVNVGVYIGLGVLDLPDNLRIAVGIDTLLVLLLMVLPLVAMVAAALLLLSGLANSYKEYQIYFLPLFLVFLLPSFAAFLPGIELRSAIVLVPVAGISVATRALLMGEGHLLWGAAALASTGAAAWLLLRRTEAALSNERLITSVEMDEAEFRGGAALFPRHVLRWFVGFWVLLFVTSLWFAEELGLHGQILFNVVGIFLGGSVLLIRRYGLDVRETLQLHRPHWRAWPAAVVGAPSLLVLAIGLGELVNTYLFPVPESMLEAFGRSLTEGLATWEFVLLLSLLPGILEEVAFRGVLLSGLRKQMRRTWMAVAVSALVFGVFHVSLFRIIPTGFLGVVLALVVLRTGSIFPAMLWHFLNNFLATVPVEQGWISLEATQGVPVAWYGAALVGAAVSWLLMCPRPGQLEPAPGGRPARTATPTGAPERERAGLAGR